MGLYRRFLFPWLCDLGLDRPFIAAQRQLLLTHAGGDVLELGLGTGLNLLYYPRAVRRIIAVEPNAGTQRRARRRAAQAGIDVDVRRCVGEYLPFAGAVFDCVVCTFTLCSIDAVDRALAEAFRVLRPGGQLLLLEHGLHPSASVQKWQRRLNPLQRLLADGCRLDRDVRRLVTAQPFGPVQLDELDLEEVPRTHGHLYRGVAVK